MKIQINVWSVFLIFMSVTSGLLADLNSKVPEMTRKYEMDSEFCSPLIIAHRGASGYVPEHTLASYALAILMGADYIEPDLVMTSDGHLIARHDNELGLTTDVAAHSEFECRHKNKTVDGKTITGWFTEDFTLEELKTLRAIERIPEIRPNNVHFNGIFLVPTFQEIIDLVKGLQTSQQRLIGLYPEIKHSTYFSSLGLPMEQTLVDILHKNGYKGYQAPVYIQSFEVNNLKELNRITKLPLIQLFEGDKTMQPFDQIQQRTSLTYGDMATLEGLREVSKYAHAVGPDKSYIIPRDENNGLSCATSFVNDAHTVGLKVHPYTFRTENYFLPSQYVTDELEPHGIGNLTAELQAYIDAGIDGFFTDHPDIAVRLRGECTKQTKVKH